MPDTGGNIHRQPEPPAFVQGMHIVSRRYGKQAAVPVRISASESGLLDIKFGLLVQERRLGHEFRLVQAGDPRRREEHRRRVVGATGQPREGRPDLGDRMTG